MTPERWKQVKRILESALEREPHERAALLDEACAGDQSLREEVETLIVSYSQAESFFDSPADEAAAGLLADEKNLLVGRRIGQYKIQRMLGRGGMGEVYLARDDRLARKVALKLLPAFFTRDQQRVRRFGQEARAASALNHPNILVIFEIGQADGFHFIATEFVEGDTLRSVIARGELSMAEALDVMVQAAGALAAAHRAGIVHRDIKPENMMLRPDGYVKVLDFGLAKLTEVKTTPGDSTVPEAIQVKTDPGMVMGTVNYMSPEQARGLAVDGRTDIFSLGVVLYEMVKGLLPFRGPTASDVIASLLTTEPQAISNYSPRAPVELQRIITRALCKDRELRYQTAEDFLADLKSLKEEMQHEARLSKGGAGVGRATTEVIARSAPMQPAQTTSSIEVIFNEIKRHKKAATLAAALMLVAIAGAAFGIYRLTRQGAATPAPALSFQNMKLARLTSTGKSVDATVSADGKYVAYVMSDAGLQSLWVKQVATASNIQVVAPVERLTFAGLTFSPDGNYIYYILTGTAGNPFTVPGVLYRIPSLGGDPKKLVENVATSVTFSPDGKQFAFRRWIGEAAENAIFIANADGTAERKLASRKVPQYYSLMDWSPDGKAIACIAGAFSGAYEVGVIEVSLEDGSERPITSRTWSGVGSVVGIAWLRDKSGLVIAAGDRRYFAQLWFVSYPGGETHRITNDLNGYYSVSLTADSKTLVAIQNNNPSNIWVTGGDASRAKQITSSSSAYDGMGGVCWAPDGRVVYHSMASGDYDLWIMNGDGGGQKIITSDDDKELFPSVTLDGRYIFFAKQGAEKGIWRIDINGDNQKQIIEEGSIVDCHSPDSRWIVYYRSATGRFGTELWRATIDGTEQTRLTDKALATRASISPDGKLLACNYSDGRPGARLGIAILPAEGGEPIKFFDYPGDAIRELRWTPDGRAITFINTVKGVSNIYRQPIEGGDPVQMTTFKSGLMYAFDLARDGSLVVAQGTATSDVILISDFK